MVRSLATHGLGLVVSAGIAFSAAAQVPSVEVPTYMASLKKFDDWEVICNKPEGTKENRCLAHQTQTVKQSNTRLIQVSLGRLGLHGEPVLVAMVPLGIWLPSGVALKIDDLPQVPMTVTQCTEKGCAAQVQVAESMMKSVLDAKAMSVGMIAAGSAQTLAIAISPKGLKSAWSAVK